MITTHSIFCISRKENDGDGGGRYWFVKNWWIFESISRSTDFRFDIVCFINKTQLMMTELIQKKNHPKLRNEDCCVFPLLNLSTNDKIYIDLVSFRSVTKFHVIFFFFMKIIKKKYVISTLTYSYFIGFCVDVGVSTKQYFSQFVSARVCLCTICLLICSTVSNGFHLRLLETFLCT